MARGRIIALTLAAAASAAAVAWIGALLIPRDAFLSTHDVWFEGDLRRVYSNMVDRHGDHYRTKVHPIFSLVAYVMTWIPRCGLHLDPVVSVRIVDTFVAALLGALLFLVLRLITQHDFGAFLFTLLGVVSASFLFWVTVPETYVFGGVAILAAMLAAAMLARGARWNDAILTITGIGTLAFTVTNFMAGLASAIASLPLKRAVQVAVNAFAIVVVLWGVQKFIFPSAQFFIGDKEERDYMYKPTLPRIAGVANAFAITSMVMPRIDPQFRDYQPQAVLFTQPSRPGSSSAIGFAAFVLWTALLVGGVAGLFSTPELRPLKLALVLTLLGQFSLHVLYGEETFLYSLHFMPLLVLLAAFSVRTRARKVAYGVAIALLICATVNNGLQFDSARRYVAAPMVKPHAG